MLWQTVFRHVFKVGVAGYIQYGEVMYHCEADTTLSAHAQFEILV